MADSTLLGPHRWYFDLSGRDKDYRFFSIPDSVVEQCGITLNSNRDLRIILSTGQVLRGFCSITGDCELSIPTHLQDDFSQAEWFVCEIIGNKTADQPNLVHASLNTSAKTSSPLWKR
jgi:hypothetical protein